MSVLDFLLGLSSFCACVGSRQVLLFSHTKSPKHLGFVQIHRLRPPKGPIFSRRTPLPVRHIDESSSFFTMIKNVTLYTSKVRKLKLIPVLVIGLKKQELLNYP